MTVRTPLPPTVRNLGKRDSAAPMREENSRLRKDISRLRIDKEQLRQENSRLLQENSQLKAENSRLRDELHFTHEELNEERNISEQKDVYMAKNNALYHILQEEHLRIQVE